MSSLSTFHATVNLISANNSHAIAGIRDETGPSALFGLQDAYAVADYPGSDFWLFEHGCHTGVNGTGPNDCTQSCSLPPQIWSDKYAMHTLANCLVYPKIAQALTYGRLDAPSLDLARRFNIEPAPQGVYNATTSVQGLNACIFEYCQENNPCDFFNDWNATTSSETDIGQGCAHLDTSPDAAPLNHLCTINMTSLCSTAPDVGAVNNDLGGPGVFVSYIIQYTVCVLAWMALNILDLWIQIFIFFVCPGPIYWYWTHPRGLAGGWKAATKVQKTFRKVLGSQHDAWLAALVEFQKTQAFFCIAISIAVYVQLSGQLNTVDAKTLQQLQNNTELSNVILYGGLYPLTFVLMLLRRYRLSTPFLVSLALITMIASSVALRLTLRTDLTKIPVQWHARNLETCDYVNPIKYCHTFVKGEDWWNRILDPKAAYVFISLQVLDALVVFPIGMDYDEATQKKRTTRVNIYNLARLHIEQLKYWTRVELFIRTKSRFLRRIGLASRHNLLSLIFWTLRYLVELLIVYFLLLCLLVLIELEGPTGTDIAMQETQFNLNNWTFGQITALLFWAPPVVEFLRISATDIVASLNTRIPQEYEVVKRDLPEEPELDPPTRAATGLVESNVPPVQLVQPELLTAKLALPLNEPQRRHSAG